MIKRLQDCIKYCAYHFWSSPYNLHVSQLRNTYLLTIFIHLTTANKSYLTNVKQINLTCQRVELRFIKTHGNLILPSSVPQHYQFSLLTLFTTGNRSKAIKWFQVQICNATIMLLRITASSTQTLFKANGRFQILNFKAKGCRS